MLPLGGCAGLQSREPIQVIMVAVEPLQGEGLELRMLVKLRIHPGSTALPGQPSILEVSVSSEALAQHRHDTKTRQAIRIWCSRDYRHQITGYIQDRPTPPAGLRI